MIYYFSWIPLVHQELPFQYWLHRIRHINPFLFLSVSKLDSFIPFSNPSLYFCSPYSSSNVNILWPYFLYIVSNSLVGMSVISDTNFIGKSLFNNFSAVSTLFFSMPFFIPFFLQLQIWTDQILLIISYYHLVYCLILFVFLYFQ